MADNEWSSNRWTGNSMVVNKASYSIAGR